MKSDEAEDLAQDTMAELVARYSDKPEEELVKLGTTIAARKLAVWFDRRRRSRLTPLDEESVDDKAGFADAIVRRQEFRTRVRSLSETCRQILFLRIQEHSFAEIRQQLNLPSEAAVQKRLSRNMDELRRSAPI
jgi:DNA-directed RNA polymerase specialized sigma24 family protein